MISTDTIYPTNTQTQLLEAIETVIKNMYQIFNRERDYKKISKAFLEVYNKYQIDNRIPTKILKKINRLQSHNPLFIKNSTDNYSVGHHAQGYYTTETFNRLTKRVYDVLALKPKVMPISKDNSTDYFTIKRSKFEKHKLHEKFLDITVTDTDVYIINDIKNYTEDNQGRIYSTFQMLPSKLKKLTDTPFEIDMSTAGQNLMLSIFHNANYKSYTPFYEITEPFHNIKEYIRTKDTKRDMYRNAMKCKNKKAKQFFTIPLYGGHLPLVKFNEATKTQKDTVYSFNTFCNEYYNEVKILRKQVFKIYQHIEKLEIEDTLKQWSEKIYNNQIIGAYYYAKRRLAEAIKKRKDYCFNTLTEYKPLKKIDIEKKIVFFMTEHYESIARNIAIDILLRH